MTLPNVILSPLIHLAIHIFSIHANSASCERLFSLFGNIQTKQRNCMASTTLQMIAEVKMRLHDSHAASWGQKQQSCTKRHFGLLPPSTHNPDHSLPGTPSVIPSSMPPPSTSLESDTEVTDDDLCPIGLREMIKDFNSLAADDVNLDLNLDNEAYVWGVRSVCELFDFSSKHWVKEHQKKCLHSLEEELNFYELLSGHDIDAVGVEESEFCDYR